ncbi:hypothetical protein ACFLVG_02525 [Chloroflexota bacterium]
MEEQERIKILELAWQIAENHCPTTRETTTEASITVWHKLFDQAYKAIFNTALGK